MRAAKADGSSTYTASIRMNLGPGGPSISRGRRQPHLVPDHRWAIRGGIVW
jgi:hypothetical protein